MGEKEVRGPVDIEGEEEEWEQETLDPVLERYPERREDFETSSQIPIRRLYSPGDTAELDYLQDLGFPGQHPFTRGVYPTMYRGRFWTMRQYAGYATAEETNERYKYLLEQGQTGLSVAFDLPTQIGYDSDHPMAEAEVGKVGVATSSVEDMERLFDGIPLERVSTSMTINATAAVLLALYIAVAEKQGVDPRELRGTVQNDILKEYVARGTYIFPPAPSLRLITDVFAYCSEKLPKWNVISVSGYHMREAGATAVQEVAFTLANAKEYVRAALRAGLAVDDFAPQVSFFFCAQNELFEEVAKFRAARRLWSRIMREEFEAQEPKSSMLRFHTQTAGAALTAQQPDNNIVRVAVQALAAVLGGTQSLHCNAKDEALALPTQESARVALRTQQILAHESGVTDTVDPLAGSYYLESLTDELEGQAATYLERIEEMGGALQAIESGFMQREIQESAYRHQQEVEENERIVVGVNEYQMEVEQPPDILKVDPAIRERQVERLEDLWRRRNAAQVEDSLAELEEAAHSDANLMPSILNCVESYATLGEICDVLRDVFGEYRPTATV